MNSLHVVGVSTHPHPTPPTHTPPTHTHTQHLRQRIVLGLIITWWFLHYQNGSVVQIQENRCGTYSYDSDFMKYPDESDKYEDFFFLEHKVQVSNTIFVFQEGKKTNRC